MISEVEFEEQLAEAVHRSYDSELMPVVQVRSFEECGVLTLNKGLVVQLEDGSEFQVTIVQSR